MSSQIYDQMSIPKLLVSNILIFYFLLFIFQSNIIAQNLEFTGINSEILIIALDKHNYKFKRASLNSKLSSCLKKYSPVSQNELESRAQGFVKSIEWYAQNPISKDSTGFVGLFKFDKISYFKDFVFFICYPNDYGNILVYDRCVGHLIYSARTEWWGKGYQIYPPEIKEKESIMKNNSKANLPDSIFVFSELENRKLNFSGLDSLLHINIVQNYAKYPYNILTFLVNSQLGLIDTDYGEWIVVFYRPFPEYNKTIK